MRDILKGNFWDREIKMILIFNSELNPDELLSITFSELSKRLQVLD